MHSISIVGYALLMIEYLGPIRESRWPGTLMHRIESITQSHGEKPAVKDGEGTVLTYSQMAVRVNPIATALSTAGIETGSIIAVLQEPKSDWIAHYLLLCALEQYIYRLIWARRFHGLLSLSMIANPALY